MKNLIGTTLQTNGGYGQRNKNYCQHTFGAIANFVVNSRSRFARNFILIENNQFRSSQLTPSVGTLVVMLNPA
jgi:hypothetical protein